jgi:hypothetical protein
MDWRALTAPLACAAALLAVSSLPALAASDKDLALFGKDPGKGKAYACFIRHYDATHLAAHPKQNVGDMTLFVNSSIDADGGRQYELEIGVHFRKRPTLFQLSGACGGSAGGKTALSCGFDCDGGRIDVRVKDAQSILVSIPDGARTWDPSSSEDPPADAKFGTDDKLFRLDRTSLHDCLPEALDDDVKADIAAPK